MSPVMAKSRNLDPEAVEAARKWRENRIKELEAIPILQLSNKERHELHRIRGYTFRQ